MDRLDQAAIITLDAVVTLAGLPGRDRSNAVATVAAATGATVDEVEALLDRAALVLAAEGAL
jgi:hypothetical protein